MQREVKEIVETELKVSVQLLEEIKDLGSVNYVYEVKSENGEYIIRINNDKNKRWDYLKEKWCIEKGKGLGIPGPRILKIGFKGNLSFMIQEKIEGINGSKSNDDQIKNIWKKLGNYALKYHKIKRIELPEIERREFHKDWKSKLRYNMDQLNSEDPLCKRGIINDREQATIKEILGTLESNHYETGLVHGDLRPGNTIYNGKDIFLIDWGTAEINIVPHTEIGIVLMYSELSKDDFVAFLHGLDISRNQFKLMENDIRGLILLHCLDKYRWAMDFGESIREYAQKVRDSFEKLRMQ